MRFLADENFPGAAVDALVRAGHDVAWIAKIAPGMPDSEVFRSAARESRVILTFDKDLEILPAAPVSRRLAEWCCFAFLCRHPPRSASVSQILSTIGQIGSDTSR
jgi:hypothetical protein